MISCIACFLLGLLLILAGRCAPDPWDLVDALLAEPPEDEEESWDPSDVFGK